MNLEFLSDERPTLETLDFAFYIGSTPTLESLANTREKSLNTNNNNDIVSLET